MVQVRTLPNSVALQHSTLEQWLRQLPMELDPADQERIGRAAEDLKNSHGAPTVATADWAGESDPFAVGLEILQILSELRLGADALIAGLLYRSVREQRVTLEQVDTALWCAGQQSA